MGIGMKSVARVIVMYTYSLDANEWDCSSSMGRGIKMPRGRGVEEIEKKKPVGRFACL